MGREGEEVIDTYHLVAAHDGHYTQWLDAMLARVKRRPSRGVTRVSEDDVRVRVGVEIRLAGAITLDEILEGGDVQQRLVEVATAVVRGAALNAVAADVHVGELAILARDVQDILGACATVLGAFGRGDCC